jgi:tripartite-type tricarboxylate transporter receptor subunit TctC
MSRRTLLSTALALGVSLGVGLAPASGSAAYPDRPINLLIAWGAGGGTDILARMFASLLEAELGQPVNVVNRTGGGGVVGHSAMATAAPDGYTIGIASMEITLYDSLGLAPLGPDSVTPIKRLAAIPSAITVAAGSPHQSVDDVLEAIRNAPHGSLQSSGCGIGCAWHLALAGWLDHEGLEADRVLWVPSQGGAPALQDLVAGGLDLVPVSIVEARALLDAGEVRSLAVMHPTRLDAFPDVPTLAEARGSDWVMATWFGLVGPVGLPDDIVETLAAAAGKVFGSEAFEAFMDERGYVPAGEEGADFAAFMHDFRDTLKPIIDDLGIAQ